MAVSSAAMLARLINDTYLSVVAFGRRRASAKARPRRRHDAQRSLHTVAKELCEEVGDLPTSCRLGYHRMQYFLAVLGYRQAAAVRVEAGPQACKRLVAHQHHKLGL